MAFDIESLYSFGLLHDAVKITAEKRKIVNDDINIIQQI